jgi:hypothetical protein
MSLSCSGWTPTTQEARRRTASHRYSRNSSLILESKRPHVVMLDDLREFGCAGSGYPALRAVREIADTHLYAFTATTDVIVLEPMAG